MQVFISNVAPTLTIVFIALISACTNSNTIDKPKGINSRFDTRISDSGLKVFSLKATIQQTLPVRSTPVKIKQTKNQLTRWLEQELARQLLSNQFCNTGHTEIERSIGTGFAIIRGECNELATHPLN